VGGHKERVTMVYFLFMYENRRMKPFKIVLRKGKGGRGRMMKEVNLRYIYVDICKYHIVVQLLYANKKEMKRKNSILKHTPKSFDIQIVSINKVLLKHSPFITYVLSMGAFAL
jgi:hypothetical protein